MEKAEMNSREAEAGGKDNATGDESTASNTSSAETSDSTSSSSPSTSAVTQEDKDALAKKTEDSKRKKNKKDKDREEEVEADSGGVGGGGEPQKIETGDSLKVKQVLDTSCLDFFRDANYDINYKSENTKIIIMLIACGFALFGQFNRVPFPDNRWILCICCFIYFSLNSLLTVVTYLDGDTIILTHKNDAEKLPALQIDGTFARFQDKYVFTIRTYTNKKLKGNSDEELTTGVRGVMYVGKYFKSTGEFLEGVFHSDIRYHIERFKSILAKSSSSDSKDASKFFETIEYSHNLPKEKNE